MQLLAREFFFLLPNYKTYIHEIKLINRYRWSWSKNLSFHKIVSICVSFFCSLTSLHQEGLILKYLLTAFISLVWFTNFRRKNSSVIVMCPVFKVSNGAQLFTTKKLTNEHVSFSVCFPWTSGNLSFNGKNLY